jgi:hypothetical protein
MLQFWPPEANATKTFYSQFFIAILLWVVKHITVVTSPEMTITAVFQS